LCKETHIYSNQKQPDFHQKITMDPNVSIKPCVLCELIIFVKNHPTSPLALSLGSCGKDVDNLRGKLANLQSKLQYTLMSNQLGCSTPEIKEQKEEFRPLNKGTTLIRNI
jgi:hypothetical protein